LVEAGAEISRSSRRGENGPEIFDKVTGGHAVGQQFVGQELDALLLLGREFAANKKALEIAESFFLGFLFGARHKGFQFDQILTGIGSQGIGPLGEGRQANEQNKE
jgi:hypothetical protein